MKLPGATPGPPDEPHPGAMLSAHLDGELDADADRTVLEHLRRCESCRAELESVRAAREAIRGLADLGGRGTSEPESAAPSLVPDAGATRRPHWGAAVAAALVGVVLLGDPAIDSSDAPLTASDPARQLIAGLSGPSPSPSLPGIAPTGSVTVEAIGGSWGSPPQADARTGLERTFWRRASRTRPASGPAAPVEQEQGPLSGLLRRLLQVLW
ncbi:MAG: anti-sigma factor family protein [Acidimicrobiia bacterium]